MKKMFRLRLFFFFFRGDTKIHVPPEVAAVPVGSTYSTVRTTMSLTRDVEGFARRAESTWFVRPRGPTLQSAVRPCSTHTMSLPLSDPLLGVEESNKPMGPSEFTLNRRRSDRAGGADVRNGGFGSKDADRENQLIPSSFPRQADRRTGRPTDGQKD